MVFKFVSKRLQHELMCYYGYFIGSFPLIGMIEKPSLPDACIQPDAHPAEQPGVQEFLHEGPVHEGASPPPKIALGFTNSSI